MVAFCCCGSERTENVCSAAGAAVKWLTAHKRAGREGVSKVVIVVNLPAGARAKCTPHCDEQVSK